MCGRRRKLCRGSVDEGGDEERMGGGTDCTRPSLGGGWVSGGAGRRCPRRSRRGCDKGGCVGGARRR